MNPSDAGTSVEGWAIPLVLVFAGLCLLAWSLFKDLVDAFGNDDTGDRVRVALWILAGSVLLVYGGEVLGSPWRLVSCLLVAAVWVATVYRSSRGRRSG